MPIAGYIHTCVLTHIANASSTKRCRKSAFLPTRPCSAKDNRPQVSQNLNSNVADTFSIFFFPCFPPQASKCWDYFISPHSISIAHWDTDLFVVWSRSCNPCICISFSVLRQGIALSVYGSESTPPICTHRLHLVWYLHSDTLSQHATVRLTYLLLLTQVYPASQTRFKKEGSLKIYSKILTRAKGKKFRGGKLCWRLSNY